MMTKRSCRRLFFAGLVSFLFFSCNTGLPPQAPEIFARRDSANTGDTVTVRFYTVEPEDQSITLWIEWGDTTEPGWSYFFPSGETIPRTHVYNRPGVYGIRAKARDIDRKESPWSQTFWMRIFDTLQVRLSP